MANVKAFRLNLGKIYQFSVKHISASVDQLKSANARAKLIGQLWTSQGKTQMVISPRSPMVRTASGEGRSGLRPQTHRTNKPTNK